ncbi:MAG: hypothetical protein M0R75_16925 [Dehalococcoidia bacterium]|nr:hypothetical protein [Dehalococcoidia bacterium]
MRTQRALLLLSSLATGALALVLLTAFFWPDAPNYPRSLNLGPVGQYEVGVPVFVPAEGYDDTRWPSVRTEVASQRAHHAGMWVVRLEDGAVRVLLARNPFEGCTTPWRATLRYEGEEGWFRDVCRRSTYTLDGRWVEGASSRDMDWLPVRVEGDGHVLVDLTTLHAGETHYGVPAGARPTPTVEGWSAR